MIIPKDSLTDTKQACVLATLGLPLHKVFIIYDKDNPQSSGGVAHFIFESGFNNQLLKWQKIYDENKADKEWDDFLDELPKDCKLTTKLLEEIKEKYARSLVVHGRKVVGNYQSWTKDLREKIAKFSVTGGSPVFLNGKIVGFENFKIGGVK